METASNNLVTNAVLHLERNNQLIESIFKIMIQKCDSDDYTFNGPGCVSEALYQICSNSSENRLTPCHNLQLLPHRFFHPVLNIFYHFFFEDVRQLSEPMLMDKI